MKKIQKHSNDTENAVECNDNPEESNTNRKETLLKTRSNTLLLKNMIQSDSSTNSNLEIPLEIIANQRKATKRKESPSNIQTEEPKEKISQAIPKLKWENLANFKKGSTSKESKLNLSSIKNKLKVTVNMEMMKEELKQLEDPPITPHEIELSSARLRYSFFDSPCETLAQNLLGKILVRQLENGMILKGRIVETESYLGVIDKASHTYQNRITPRNIPMYMPPGTIYVYLTYGMYHCFNISSQEPGACVFIRAVEPLLGLNYMELLRNTRLKRGKKEKEMIKRPKLLKSHQLCNGPFKLCTAFDIDKDTFNEKNISDGCAVLVRSIEPLEGMDFMINLRSSKPKSKKLQTSVKSFKPHELCNGPSKLCMAFNLEKQHSKYSMCSWKHMWLEDDAEEQKINIVRCARIGIDSAGLEWANKPLRYYIYGNKSVSKRNKIAETALFQTD